MGLFPLGFFNGASEKLLRLIGGVLSEPTTVTRGPDTPGLPGERETDQSSEAKVTFYELFLFTKFLSLLRYLRRKAVNENTCVS